MTLPVLTDGGMRHWLSDWDSHAPITQTTQQDGLLERLRQVLHAMATTRRCSSEVDLVALVRQWMLRVAASNSPPWLRVPSATPWPSAKTWERAGFDVAPSSRYLDIKPRMPRLNWLGEQSDLFDDVFACKKARALTSIPADPFFKEQLGHEVYTGPGQREAVRALMQSPPDVTLIANLPTGCGKSVLAQLPPLQRREGFLTLVVLPTVALAIDQERRMQELFARQDAHWEARPLAFHGSLSKDERAQVFRALREGRQRVLFTSPEAATGSLRASLTECASLGRITDVVIDEAHIVASWGNGFRPAFQLLPALIHSLRAATPTDSPIRVTLASATLTQNTLEVLQQHFGGPEKTEVISSVYLRAEPRYASLDCGSDENKRQELVLEALRIAPRPFILYVTRPEEADRWVRLLRLHDFNRIASFTGETQSDERKKLLGQWSRNELDGMVATSAFGLGVDKGDVRTIVHATLPESLDRFYQEVGRSGRDGHASASLLLFTNEDVSQASSMRSPSFIGNEIGHDRWIAMVGRAFQLDPTSSEWWIDLNIRRPKLQIKGTTNRSWNIRTLNLMAQAGMIELTQLSSVDPRDKAGASSDEAFNHDLAFAAIRIIEGNHRDKVTFDACANSVRRAYEDSSRIAFDALLELAHGRRSVEDSLAEIYSLSGTGTWTPVTPQCGGCWEDWLTRPGTPVTPEPVVGRLNRFAEARSLSWPDTLPKTTSSLAIISVDQMPDALFNTPLIASLIKRMNPHTVATTVCEDHRITEKLLQTLSKSRANIFFDKIESEDTFSLQCGIGEVRIVIWMKPVLPPHAALDLWSDYGGHTVLVMGSQVPDPNRPDRRLLSMVPHTTHLDFLRAVSI